MKHLFFLLFFAACAQKPKRVDIIAYTQESTPYNPYLLGETANFFYTAHLSDTATPLRSLHKKVRSQSHKKHNTFQNSTTLYTNSQITQRDSYVTIRLGDYISSLTEVSNGIPFSVIDSLTKVNHKYILTGDTIFETKHLHFNSWYCCYTQNTADLFDANKLIIENGVITIYGKGDTTEITSPDFDKVKNFFIKKRNGPNTYYPLYYENPTFQKPDSVIQTPKNR